MNVTDIWGGLHIPGLSNPGGRASTLPFWEGQPAPQVRDYGASPNFPLLTQQFQEQMAADSATVQANAARREAERQAQFELARQQHEQQLAQMREAAQLPPMEEMVSQARARQMASDFAARNPDMARRAGIWGSGAGAPRQSMPKGTGKYVPGTKEPIPQQSSATMEELQGLLAQIEQRSVPVPFDQSRRMIVGGKANKENGNLYREAARIARELGVDVDLPSLSGNPNPQGPGRLMDIEDNPGGGRRGIDEFERVRWIDTQHDAQGNLTARGQQLQDRRDLVAQRGINRANAREAGRNIDQAGGLINYLMAMGGEGGEGFDQAMALMNPDAAAALGRNQAMMETARLESQDRQAALMAENKRWEAQNSPMNQLGQMIVALGGNPAAVPLIANLLPQYAQGQGWQGAQWQMPEPLPGVVPGETDPMDILSIVMSKYPDGGQQALDVLRSHGVLDSQIEALLKQVQPYGGLGATGYYPEDRGPGHGNRSYSISPWGVEPESETLRRQATERYLIGLRNLLGIK